MATKLLIVDDEPFTVDMLETFLQINGFETVGALNGEDGLTLVRVEQPELVILDLMLPDIEGYEVCKRIRAYPQSASLPVLVLSARAESASKERAMEAGADAYLVKPVQFPALLTELNRLLELKRSATAAPAEAPAQPASPAPEAFTSPSTPIPLTIPATPVTPSAPPAQPVQSPAPTPNASPAQPAMPSPSTTSKPSPIPFHHSDPPKPSAPPVQPSTTSTTNTPPPAQTSSGEPQQPATPPQAPSTPDPKLGDKPSWLD